MQAPCSLIMTMRRCGIFLQPTTGLNAGMKTTKLLFTASEDPHHHSLAPRLTHPRYETSGSNCDRGARSYRIRSAVRYRCPVSAMDLCERHDSLPKLDRNFAACAGYRLLSHRFHAVHRSLSAALSLCVKSARSVCRSSIASGSRGKISGNARRYRRRRNDIFLRETSLGIKERFYRGGSVSV